MQKAPKLRSSEALQQGIMANLSNQKCSHNILFCQGICAECIYLKTVILPSNYLRHICTFTGEKMRTTSGTCSFFTSKVTAYGL